MCGRFSNRYTWKELHDLYRAFLDSTETDWTPKFNIAPTTQIPVLRNMDGNRRIDLMRWGLVPSWSKEIGKFSTFNARSDGVASKPTYRGAWKAGRRCVIPASSFFEWKKLDANTKQPFAIGMGNRGPMSFAGLWEESQVAGLSVTMITCEPNNLMAQIHDRMPVIIGDEDLPAWLGEEKASNDDLRAMLRPFQPERMSAWKVTAAVGKVQNQGPELVEPATP
jgi:putative SOS response-associated peptidase YedK